MYLQLPREILHRTIVIITKLPMCVMPCDNSKIHVIRTRMSYVVQACPQRLVNMNHICMIPFGLHDRGPNLHHADVMQNLVHYKRSQLKSKTKVNARDMVNILQKHGTLAKRRSDTTTGWFDLDRYSSLM